ncbi:alpha/beta hydrolase family protein [Pseudochrobactrum asaccharolyticum]|uniref:Platelet-activating factor acetylhydrolase isoform II n=1 Tax=Pseudochrobactrum asaccharolyticum TaxID=354351 RepID=A0A366DLI4_9HYPH|nr:alpha/beta fold hydrolase [Pseudochrobactrum asaccharolyticum]RBO90942.1 platelet-activating factor acetylhydrolase isoform II [Pseudochrobactrum asaccharolyticum]
MANHRAGKISVPIVDLPAVVSVAPIIIPAPGRGLDLHIRVSAPIVGDALPIIVFSHGNGQSLHAYGPLASYWAAQGFVVIQPTHLDSRMIDLALDDPRRPRLWHFREEDLVRILDELDSIEEMVPLIRGRLDRERIAVAGHSWGAQTAGTLLGATHPHPEDGSVVNRKDARIKAGVLLSVPGSGGGLSANAARNFPFMYPDFSTMSTPTLIVAGDNNKVSMTIRGPVWWREAYDLSSAPKALFTVFGGEHSLGGISGYEARETTDERPERVAAIQRLTTAYLYSALYAGNSAWREARAELAAAQNPEGSIETK